MNRRMFLSSSAGLAASASLGSSRKLYAQTTLTAPYNASMAAHSIATCNYVSGTSTSSDWTTVANTMRAATSDWTTSQRDTGVIAAVPNISPSMVHSSALDQNALLANLQLYSPTFTLVQLQRLLHLIDQNQAMVPGVLSQIRASGMTYYMNVAINEAANLALTLDSGGAPPAVGTSGVRSQAKYGCTQDAAIVLGAGIAFATLAVMTLGTAPVLVGAAWVGIATWGGIGAGAYSAGHFAYCGL